MIQPGPRHAAHGLGRLLRLSLQRLEDLRLLAHAPVRHGHPRLRRRAADAGDRRGPLHNGADGRPGYASASSHAEEDARPGYYAVTLNDTSIRAELTTTLRVGVHRYAFPAGSSRARRAGPEHRDQVLDSALASVSDTEVTGIRRSRSLGARPARLLRRSILAPVQGAAGRTREAGCDGRGDRNASRFDFGTRRRAAARQGRHLARSASTARGRTSTPRVPGWDFDAVRAAADAAWEQELGRSRSRAARATSARSSTRRSITRCSRPTSPWTWTASYRGMDRRCIAPTGSRTTRSSRCGTRSARASAAHAHRSPRARATSSRPSCGSTSRAAGCRCGSWPRNETDTMIGYHAVPVIADAIREGHRRLRRRAGARGDEGQRRRTASASLPTSSAASSTPSDEARACRRTLEYAYDDWCIAQSRDALGRARTIADFLRRAQAWQAPVRPVDRLHAPARRGPLARALRSARSQLPLHRGERVAVQLLRAPRHRRADARGWAGRGVCARSSTRCSRADSQHDRPRAGRHHRPRSASTRTATSPATTWPTSTPSPASPGRRRRWCAASWTRCTRTTRRPVGNEDCGQMSAWYVLSALGFYR